MIYSIEGSLVLLEPLEHCYLAAVACGGIAYEVKTTFTTAQQSPTLGSPIKLYTHLSVREDALELFGFAEMEEKRCFLLLTSVSGVGPRAALSILSGLSPDKLALCIAAGDSKPLTDCKGIGNKTAQRILLELKDKFTDLEVRFGIANSSVSMPIPDSSASEAISALVTLGYSKSEAAGAIAHLSPDASAEEMIKIALKSLSNMK